MVERNFFLYCILFLLQVIPSIVFANEEIIVREPAVAGQFYDSNPEVLRNQINSFLNVPEGKVKDGGSRPIALISPHAGYIYSGLVVGYGYSVIRKYDYRRVIILAPSHYKRYRGVSIVKFTHYKTPLGLVEVDREVCDKLLGSNVTFGDDKQLLYGTLPSAHIIEHSIETQLPFLQIALKDFKIVPLLFGYLKDDDFDKVAKSLKPYIDKRTLLIVSSDFMHYGDRYGYIPFRNNVEENIKKYDEAAFNEIISINFDNLMNYKKETGSTICGFIPIAALMKILPKNSKGQLLMYDTSGRQTGDFSYSVSYASIVFTIN